MATIKDIAAAAGVSTATVSRVLNGGKGISQKTQEHVQKIAAELNYMPNLSAQMLVGKSSKIIGMIVPEIDSNYFAKMISLVEAELQKSGYSLMIITTQYRREKEILALRTFCTYNVDGIFLTCTINYDILTEFAPLLSQKKIPLILLEARLHTADYSYIMVDDEAGMLEAILYLRSLGYSKIGFIGDYILDKLRNEQFIGALKQAGLDPADHPIYSHPTRRFEMSGYETMQRILLDKDRPSAFLAGYDDIAIGAIRAATEAGLSVPEDIAIIGNDDILQSPFLTRSLTTLSPPLDKLAELGAQIMVGSIEGKYDGIVQHISLKPELVIRETV